MRKSSAALCPAKPRLVVLGASTGGPGVLLSILQDLPRSFQTPILIAQHMERSFMSGFISWLESELDRPIELVKEGSKVLSGAIFVADVIGNLSVTPSLTFHYTPPSPDQLYTPNIDYLFSSLASLELEASASLLTGMGNDGARGLKQLADKGWATYVQSGETCIVNGMPDAALKLSPRHHVATPKQISQFIRTHELAKTRCTYGK